MLTLAFEYQTKPHNVRRRSFVKLPCVCSIVRQNMSTAAITSEGGRRGQKLYIEVAQRRKSPLQADQIVDIIWTRFLSLRLRIDGVRPGVFHYAEPSLSTTAAASNADADATIPTHIETITLCNAIDEPLTRDNVSILIYRLIESGPVPRFMSNDASGDNDGDASGDGAADKQQASNHCLLPSREYHGLWESLHFESNVKENLLRFVETSMLFADRRIDPHIISCNRLVLLHGPPGTGKTSLCKAIAQKLAVRCAHRYRFTHLIEINSHSLFSKWFSESGKLVQQLFDHIRRVLEHDGSLVCLLIDEVESIAFARASVSASEPSDSLRVVNALLTQLDQIRHRPNVLVLTTSNLTGSIDVAFVDRADIRQYIGHPTADACFAIYASAIGELMRAGIIVTAAAEMPDIVMARVSRDDEEEMRDDRRRNSVRLLRLAEGSVGLSGRTLRKLPFLAHALHLRADAVTLHEFLAGLEAALAKHRADVQQLREGGGGGDAEAAVVVRPNATNGKSNGATRVGV